jgi:ABC-2 type transport system ATP-binding protein
MRNATETPNAIEIRDLVRRFGRTEAVKGLSLTVRPGRCYGLFGRNGAGKTTTIKCLLGHLRPTAGRIAVFGLNPLRHEVAVKSRIGYVPEVTGFYPWMSARNMLDYAASFRPRQWNRKLEKDLLERFGLDPAKKINAMSKGMRAQLSLICAIAAEPDLLLLDEPTSGLDPIVRRDFIQTVIGAYQEGAPERRTVFVSTHLIGEFEGLIDEFTIMDEGRAVITLESDAARERYRKVRMRFETAPPAIPKMDGVLSVKTDGRAVELLTDSWSPELENRLRALRPEDLSAEPLSLEEIFVATGRLAQSGEKTS